MKYAVSMPLYHKISYLTAEGLETTNREHATLWNTREEAERARLAYAPTVDSSTVEEIPDEAAFRREE